MDAELKREIMLDNYLNPFNKETKDGSYIKVNGNNVSCIDDINLFLKIEDGIIKETYFDGDACAISTSSTSIMLKNIIGKTIDEVKEYIANFEAMVYEKEYQEEILGEALVYNEIYKQESRKTCATLPYTALKKAIDEYYKNQANY